MTSQSERYVCLDLNHTEVGWDGKQYRQVKCWCGKVLAFAGLGGHLYHKHKQKRKDVIIE